MMKSIILIKKLPFFAVLFVILLSACTFYGPRKEIEVAKFTVSSFSEDTKLGYNDWQKGEFTEMTNGQINITVDFKTTNTITIFNGTTKDIYKIKDKNIMKNGKDLIYDLNVDRTSILDFPPKILLVCLGRGTTLLILENFGGNKRTNYSLKEMQ